jgi:nucleoside-diphosphate-sugar epimerase
MKLIVAGATGFVGTEVVRQALRNPAVTSVVALARKPLLPPTNAGPSADTSKLQAIVLEDWTSPYPGFVSEHIKGADACIWSVNPELQFRRKESHAFSYRTLAVTPTKSREMDFAEVTKICSDYTINGLENIATLANRPFRFVYTSGVLIERDQSKSLPFLADYRHMRVRLRSFRPPVL